MVLIPRVGFGGKDTADNILRRGGKKIPTWQNPEQPNLFMFQCQELSRIWLWGLREVPQAPRIFHGGSDIAEGHRTTRALHKSDGAGKGENQFVSRQIGLFVTEGQSCDLK